MKNKKNIVTIVAFMALVLITSACSNKKDSNSISFAGSGGYPPFNFMLDDGSADGFDVDVAKEIASRMGKELKYVTTSWDGIIEGLRAGRYDGILGSMAITEERMKIVDFSDAYYFSGPQLIVRKDSGITGIESLTKDMTIALVTGTTFEQDAANAGITAKLYEDDNQTLLELINGRVNGVLTDRIVGLTAISKLKGGEALKTVGKVLRTESMGIAFQKDSPLTQEVSTILSDMRKDGTLKKISEKWFPGEDITVQ